MAQWHNGAMAQRQNGAMAQRLNGTTVRWSDGTTVPTIPRPSGCRDFGLPSLSGVIALKDYPAILSILFT